MSSFQIDRRSISNFDWWLLFVALAINIIGVVNLASAAEGGAWKTQLIRFGVALILGALSLGIDYKSFEKMAPLIYGFCFILLVGVLFFGRTVNGATSWYDFKIMRLQPSELMKLALIIIIARVYHRDVEEKPWGIRQLAWPSALVIAPVIVVLLEPDAGTALIMLLVCSTMFVFAGVKKKILVFAFLVFIAFAASYPIWKKALPPHQQARINVWIYPNKDPNGAGYNVLQSKIAVGSGGMFGKGFKHGSVHMLRFLPEQQTDFVFSVWAEEWGFFWVLVALTLYCLLVVRGLQAAQQAKDKFGVMLAFGCSALIFWHAFINVGMVVGVTPVIGVPLAFMSYGGSNLLAFMLAAAIILNVRMRKYFF